MKNLNGFFPALKGIVKSFVLFLTKKNIHTKALIKIKRLKISEMICFLLTVFINNYILSISII